MDIRSGVRTTEFWINLLAFLAGVFLASGVLPETHWGMKLAGAVLAGLGALGYTASRTVLKSGSKLLLPFALLGALMSGCTWQQATKTSADVAGSLAASARTVGDEASKAECNKVLLACAAAKDSACPPLAECQSRRHTFNGVLLGVQTARYGAYSAILVGDKKKAEGWVSALKDAGAKIEAALRAWRVIP